VVIWHQAGARLCAGLRRFKSWSANQPLLAAPLLTQFLAAAAGANFSAVRRSARVVGLNRRYGRVQFLLDEIFRARFYLVENLCQVGAEHADAQQIGGTEK